MLSVSLRVGIGCDWGCEGGRMGMVKLYKDTQFFKLPLDPHIHILVPLCAT